MRFSILAASFDGVPPDDIAVSGGLAETIVEHNISCAAIRRSESGVSSLALMSVVEQKLGSLGLKYSCAGSIEPRPDRPGGCVMLAQLPILGTVSDGGAGARLAVSPDVSVDVYSLRADDLPARDVPDFVDRSVRGFQAQWRTDRSTRKRGRPFTHSGRPGPDTRIICVAAHFVAAGDRELDDAMVAAGFYPAVFGADVPDRIYLKPAIGPTGQRALAIPVGDGTRPLYAALVEFEV